jgi:ABC-2 type transport system permease protein
VIFDRLDLAPAVRATFDPGITWGGWPVPTAVEVAVVVVTCLVLLGLAVARFARTE